MDSFIVRNIPTAQYENDELEDMVENHIRHQKSLKAHLLFLQREAQLKDIIMQVCEIDDRNNGKVTASMLKTIIGDANIVGLAVTRLISEGRIKRSKGFRYSGVNYHYSIDGQALMPSLSFGDKLIRVIAL